MPVHGAWDNYQVMNRGMMGSRFKNILRNDWIMKVAVWLFAYGFYLFNLAPGLALEDSGEMIASAITLSNTHMPGYPFLMLLGKLFSFIPVGSPGFRINLASAAAGASAVGILWVVVYKLVKESGAGLMAAMGAGAVAIFAYGLAPRVWEYSGMGDKYALFMAVYAGAVLTMLLFIRQPTVRSGLVASLFSGLALSLHFMGLYLVPVLGWILFRKVDGKRIMGVRHLALAVLLFSLPVLGRTIYPPIRAEAGAPINWEVPNRVDRLVSYLTVAQYRDRLHSVVSIGKMSLETVGNAWWVLRAEVLPILLFGLIGLGVVFISPVLRPTGLLLVGLAVSGVIVAAPFGEKNVAHMHMALCWIAAIFGGVGMGWLISRNRMSLILVAALAVFQFMRGWPVGMQSQRYSAWDHMRNITARLQGPGIVAAYSDVWLFPLWYAIEVEGMAPGVKVITRRSLNLNTPEHKKLADIPGVNMDRIDVCQNEIPILWELSGQIRPRTLWMEPMGMPMPSHGAIWDGALVRISGSSLEFGMLKNPVSYWKRMRTHRLMSPRTDYEVGILAGIGRTIAAQALLLRDAGRKEESGELVRLGSRLIPGLPEMGELSVTRPVVGDAAKQASAGLVYSGMEEYNRGRFRRASDAWNSALRIDPHQYQASYELGKLAEMEGSFKEAYRIYSGLYAETPWVREVGEARSRAKTSISQQDSLPGLISSASTGSAKSLCDLGNACFGLNRTYSAELFYRRALAVDPRYARAWRNLGSAMVMRGEHRKAVEAFIKSSKYNPDDSEVMADIAMVLMQLGDSREAREWVKKAEKLAPKDPRVMAAIAMVGEK